MRPVRIIRCAVAVAAAVVIAGCTTNAPLQPSTAVAPAEAAPAAPVRPAANGAPRTLPSPSATPIATSPRQTLTPAPTPTPRAAPRRPHFATPQASMRYLAAAYNHNDLVALKFPLASHRSGHGHAHFTAAPAGRPGWYMTVLEACD